MEVYLLESVYLDEVISESILISELILHIPNTDYYLGIYGYEDYDTIESRGWTNKFWESVKSQRNHKLTKLGVL